MEDMFAICRSRCFLYLSDGESLWIFLNIMMFRINVKRLRKEDNLKIIKVMFEDG